MNEVVVVKNLKKEIELAQGNVLEVLSDISFEIKQGEFVSIVGPSGSGKSTLLYCISSLLPPTEGEVLIKGKSPYEWSASKLAKFRRQEIGFIFQDFRLFPEYTVRDNILIPFYLDHRTPDEQMLRKLTEILGIAEKLDARPSQISGGQQQRVAIARALIGKPRIVFADEPTGNLDVETGKSIVELLHNICESGSSVVMTTHNLQLLKEYPGSVYRCSEHRITDVTDEYMPRQRTIEIDLNIDN